MFTNSIVARSFRILSVSDRKKLFGVVLIQIFFGLLDLAGVALVGVLGALAVNGVQSRSPGNRVSEVLRFLNIDQLSLQEQATVIGLLAATLLISKTVLSVLFVRKTMFFLARRSALISSDLISRVLAQPLIKIQSRSMQQTLYTVTAGVDAVVLGVLNAIILVISDLSLLVILGIGLFLVDPGVALSTLIVFSCIVYILYRVLQVRAVKLGELDRLLTIESSEKTLEVLNSYREIVVRNRRNYYAREIGRIRFDLADVTAERNFMPNISKYVIEITVVIGSLAIAGIQFAINDASRAIAVLSVFTAASTRISPAVLRLQQTAVGIKSNIGSAAPTLNLIDEVKNLGESNETVDELNFVHNGFKADIELDDVSLTYPSKKKPAINSISLKIKSGQVASFVGQSGAGKTTLIDVILGVLEPDSGNVKIHGRRPLDAIREWPGAIGYVPQDVMVSNGTIKENVCLGYPADRVPDEEIWKALQVSQLYDFVKSLPDQLSTHVGDRGAKLSGGQRQRLGIARAMFTKPKLLVLDEATSSLDGVTEADITDAVNNLKGGVTVIIIAHRLSTVRESDVIHYMSNGQLTKSGTFEELKAAVPDFAKQAKLMGL
jgi:ABC-type multidrug transport system fused ATPase/permease subunit